MGNKRRRSSKKVERVRADVERPDQSSNAGAERGDRVTASDVVAYALPLHYKCRGRGIAEKKVSGGERVAVPCSCATKRFRRAHPEIVVDRDGNAWWPAKKPPAALPAAEGRSQAMKINFERLYGVDPKVEGEP